MAPQSETARSSALARRPADGMAISFGEGGDRSTVWLTGELDLASAVHVRSALCALGGRTVVVDLSRLAFIDAAGLSALLLGRDRLAETGRRLRLRGARGPVRQVFELSGLAHLIDDAA